MRCMAPVGGGAWPVRFRIDACAKAKDAEVIAVIERRKMDG
jgi:hypothetical protein